MKTEHAPVQSSKPESENRGKITEKITVRIPAGANLNDYVVTNDDTCFTDAFEHLRITTEKEIPNPPPAITMRGAAIASAGNLTVISAPSKSGKTAVTNALAAGAISEDGDIDGFTGLDVEPNPDRLAVICIDTEQAEIDSQYNAKVVRIRAGYNSTPDHHLLYNIRPLPLSEYEETTTAIIEACAQQFGGVHLIIIDGGADFVSSVNEEGEANSIITYFTQLAIKYACPVVVVIHTNPNGLKERGHIGSALQRKCYAMLSLERSGDVTKLSIKMARRASEADTKPILFKYDAEKGYHRSVDQISESEAFESSYQREIKELMNAAFVSGELITHTEAVKQIMKHGRKQDRAAKDALKNAVGWGYVDKVGEGRTGRYGLSLIE